MSTSSAEATAIRAAVAKARESAPWIDSEVADRFITAGLTLEQAQGRLFEMLTSQAGVDHAAASVLRSAGRTPSFATR